jgi:hypothetical protein
MIYQKRTGNYFVFLVLSFCMIPLVQCEFEREWSVESLIMVPSTLTLVIKPALNQCLDSHRYFESSQLLPGTAVSVDGGVVIGDELVHLSRDVAVDGGILLCGELGGLPVGGECQLDHLVDVFLGLQRHGCSGG